MTDQTPEKVECPTCGKQGLAVTKDGYVRVHRAPSGARCEGF